MVHGRAGTVHQRAGRSHNAMFWPTTKGMLSASLCCGTSSDQRNRSILDLGERSLLVHLVEVGFVALLHRKFLVRLGQSAHVLLEVRLPAEEQFVIVGSTVRSGTDPSKAPGIHQPIERMVVAVLEEERHDEALKHARLQDLPRPTMRHPKKSRGKHLVQNHRLLEQAQTNAIRLSTTLTM